MRLIVVSKIPKIIFYNLKFVSKSVGNESRESVSL